MKQFIFLSLVLVAFGNDLVAQQKPTDISGENIDVIKDYRPQLADAVKVRTDATLPEPDTTKSKFTYNISPTVVTLPYKPAMLRPVAMSRESDSDTLQNSYVKLGFGTQWSPLLDAHIANGRNDKISYALNAFHHSADGAEKFKNFSDNRYDATIKFPGKKIAVALQGGYESNTVYYYAFDESDSILSEAPNSGLRQRYTNAGGKLLFENSTPNKVGVNYHFTVGDNYFFSSRNLSENTFNVGLGFTKSFLDYHTVGLDLGVDYITSTYVDSATNHFLVPIHPYYEYRKDNYYLRGGFTVVPADAGTGVLFYPDVYAQVKLADGKVVPFVQASGHITKFLAHELSNINPWINETAPQVIGKYIELQGGFKGSFADRWAYAIRLGYKFHDYLPIFKAFEGPVVAFNVIDPGTLDSNASTLIGYAEGVQELNPHAEIGYRFSDKIGLTLQGDYYKYTLDFDDPAYGYPDWKISFGGHYNLGDKIIIKADLFALPKTQQLLHRYLQADSIVSVKGFVDGNIEAIYNYKKNFGAFISLNNLSASKYARWQRYESYGFNLKAGIILKF